MTDTPPSITMDDYPMPSIQRPHRGIGNFMRPANIAAYDEDDIAAMMPPCEALDEWCFSSGHEAWVAVRECAGSVASCLVDASFWVCSPCIDWAINQSMSSSSSGVGNRTDPQAPRWAQLPWWCCCCAVCCKYRLSYGIVAFGDESDTNTDDDITQREEIGGRPGAEWETGPQYEITYSKDDEEKNTKGVSLAN